MLLTSRTLLLLLMVTLLVMWLFGWRGNAGIKENFFWGNILPTNYIDPRYRRINEDPYDNYYEYTRVGDPYGVDMNCGNVNIVDVLKWLDQTDPEVLYTHVYKYDPSISVWNPAHTPRVLRMLLQNLPQKHKYTRILRKCLPKQVRIA